MEKKSHKSTPGHSQNSLESLVGYTIERNPKGLMKLFYQNGELPYGHSEPVQAYLRRNSIGLVREGREEGMRTLLSAHPDKELILELFAPTPAVPAFTQADEFSNFTGNERKPLWSEGQASEPGVKEGPVLLVVFLIIAALIYLVWH